MTQHNNQKNQGEESLTASQEMYLKTIYLICEEQKVARVKDIASNLDVSMSSVNGGIKSLVARGLCEHNRYGYVDLSEEGPQIAEDLVERHRVLTLFLRDVLGVSEQVALDDACEMEHVVSPETVRRVIRFTRFLTNSNEDGQRILEAYHAAIATPGR